MNLKAKGYAMNNAESILDKVDGVEHAKAILKNTPKFIREAIDQNETLYNPRTQKYIERGIQSALIQLDDSDGYFHTTMPYTSSFYSECVNLNDLRKALANRK